MNNYYVVGGISQDLSSMKVTLIVEDFETMRKERVKIDLYEREAVHLFAIQIAELFTENPDQVAAELLQLTDELEIYREQQIEQHKASYTGKRNRTAIPPEMQKRCLEFLRQPDLIAQLDQL